MKKVGLFFGSFNPIHIGHLIIASYFADHSPLDEIWFVPSPHNPLKNKATLLDDRQRLYMVQLATEDDSRFKVSNIELHLPQPSYTIHTLTALHEKHPSYDFVLIMGSDNLETLYKWKNYEQIIENHDIYVYLRPDTSIPQKWNEHPRITFFQAPLMQISSSFIRQEIKDGHSFEYYLPAKVYRFIEEMNFYKK